MAIQEHVDILKQGVDVWNKWRKEHPDIKPDLRDANLNRIRLQVVNQVINLAKADLRGATLVNADLAHANLVAADLRGATLVDAHLNHADLSIAHLWDANLQGTILRSANLEGTVLINANLRGADLQSAILLRTNLEGADITGCSVHGVSAWNVELKGTTQLDLVITDYYEPKLTVDNLKVAQFIYLLLNNREIREVIDTITSKVVLILGRFTPERKRVLDALRNELRKYNYSPVVFDFIPSAKRDLTETISTLAHISCFVIADITDAKSIPQELQAIIPHLPSVPIQPILHVDAREYAMFEHYERYPWVLPVYRYRDISSLLTSIQEHIIEPVEQKTSEKGKTIELEEEVRMLRKRVKELERRE